MTGPLNLAAVLAWNRANLRARLDYYAFPSRACHGCGEPTIGTHCPACVLHNDRQKKRRLRLKGERP